MSFHTKKERKELEAKIAGGTHCGQCMIFDSPDKYIKFKEYQEKNCDHNPKIFIGTQTLVDFSDGKCSYQFGELCYECSKEFQDPNHREFEMKRKKYITTKNKFRDEYYSLYKKKKTKEEMLITSIKMIEVLKKDLIKLDEDISNLAKENCEYMKNNVKFE